MTQVASRRVQPPDKPVHVLVVVVGAYLAMDELPGAGAFAEEIVAFWRGPRLLTNDHRLSSVAVLASDPRGRVAIPDDAGRPLVVDEPTYQACRDALLAWARQIRASGGMGVLHWIGHGRETAANGGVTSLYVHGGGEDNLSEQAGLDWTRALHTINGITQDLPVYCFIDACRVEDGATVSFDGIGRCDTRWVDKVIVFQSCRRGTSSFWLDRPTPAVVKAGCNGEAAATRAFMEALRSYGARFAGERAVRHPIHAAELVQGSTALLRRWLTHQNIPGGSTTGPGWECPDPILFTEEPMSVVDVARTAPRGASTCSAQPTPPSGVERSETARVPFQFRLRREDHVFVFDATSSGPQPILHPKVSL